VVIYLLSPLPIKLSGAELNSTMNTGWGCWLGLLQYRQGAIRWLPPNF